MTIDLSPLADMIVERLQGNLSPDEVMDTKTAAAFLLVSERTVLNWAAAGVIPGRKLDGIWRFRRTAILNCITDPTVKREEAAHAAD